MCVSFIINRYALVINNLFIFANMMNYNPNDLHSSAIIIQEGLQPTVLINNSILTGAQFQLFLSTGKAGLYSTIFQNSFTAIMTYSMEEFVMSDCQVKNNGRFNGPISTDQYSLNTPGQGIKIFQSSNIVLNNNTISAFDPNGLLMYQMSTNITTSHNTFDINAQELYYNVSSDELYFVETYCPVLYNLCSNSTTINNRFQQNSIAPETAWLSYLYNEEAHCLSGNTFTNYAIYSNDTNITSCFRHDLIDCIYHMQFMDGCLNISNTLYHQDGYFIVNTTTSDLRQIIIINIANGIIALDNINLLFTDSNETSLQNDSIANV
eukprot:277480_1